MNEENSNTQSEQSAGRTIDFPTLVYKMGKDMNFLGVIAVIYGILSCLSIIGAVVGIPIIFAGMRMRESSDYYKAYSQSKDMSILTSAVERQERFLYIFKIAAIIGIILLALGVILNIYVLAMFFTDGMDLMNSFNQAA